MARPPLALSLRRSRSDRPPQMPNRSSFSSAYSRHSARTSQSGKPSWLPGAAALLRAERLGVGPAHSARFPQPKPAMSSGSRKTWASGTMASVMKSLRPWKRRSTLRGAARRGNRAPLLPRRIFGRWPGSARQQGLDYGLPVPAVASCGPDDAAEPALFGPPPDCPGVDAEQGRYLTRVQRSAAGTRAADWGVDMRRGPFRNKAASQVPGA